MAVLGKEFQLSLVRAVIGLQATAEPSPTGRDASGRLSREITGEVLERMLSDLQLGEFIYEQPAVGDVEYTFKHALTQEVAYNSILSDRRKLLHERTGVAIEKLYAASIDDHLSELAHHYSRSGNAPKAIEYLERAGGRAVERSAYIEAVSHFSAALELLRAMPHSPQRAERELALLLALGPSVQVTKGWSAQEAEAVYLRARELCREVGETRQLFPALFGLAAYYAVGGEYKPAREIMDECLSLAERSGNSNMLVQAYHQLGWLQAFTGELASARQSQDELVTRYDSKRHHPLAHLYGGDDPAVCCLGIRGLTLWLLGYPDPELGRNKYRNNDFAFAATDHDGFACPVGSHIRRANPRDALAFPAEPKRSLTIANRHRIIRRGRPYHEVSAATGEVVEQGLLFVAINATLHRQFEFIQQSWLNNTKFNGLYDERDPLSSANPGDGMMTIQAKPVRERLHGLPRFVTVRGGAYFFLPSIRALKFLAQIR